MLDVEHLVGGLKGAGEGVANTAPRDGISSLMCSRGRGLALKAARRCCLPGGGLASLERVGRGYSESAAASPHEGTFPGCLAGGPASG